MSGHSYNPTPAIEDQTKQLRNSSTVATVIAVLAIVITCITAVVDYCGDLEWQKKQLEELKAIRLELQKQKAE